MPVQDDPQLLCRPEEKADREIANQQAVIEYLAYLVEQGRKRITEGDLLEIHRLTIAGIYPCAGRYRDAHHEIKIIGSRHRPAEPAFIQIEVRDMLDWHYSEAGKAAGELRRAARMLWKINAIHPFNGGNGRVARAMAYLAIVTEIAPIFAGEPLPLKLKHRKSDYLNALYAADAGNLLPLETLVTECLTDQLRAELDEITSAKGPGKGLIGFAGWVIGKLVAAFTKNSPQS
jgi:fido (protein-threonine AMPylation protein)